ncbi:MAG: DUF4956 domain-containing protein [Clostridia bacterium]|nr:DUF4956 domain-containing protein [Clostridia bacterium]
MNIMEVLKKILTQTFTTGDVSVRVVILTLVITCVFAAYVFFVYRFLTRKTFYDKSFNISLAAITVIVAAIIMTVQSSLVVSLGMVGALSIVRFRTAIKSPMDLIFLFWAISIGIICGAGLPGIAFITSIVLTIGIFLLDLIPVARAPKILVVHAGSKDVKGSVFEVLDREVKHYKVKSQTVDSKKYSLIVEIRAKDENAVIDGISAVEGVDRCSLLSHEGEVTF